MKIWMIWVSDGEATWLSTAWDDESRGEAREQWDEELAETIATHGLDHVRVLTTDIAMTNVQAAFEPPVLVNTGTAKEATV